MSSKLIYRFVVGIRGFHVYQNCWTPEIGQCLGFFQEPNNKYDCYAVAAKIKIKRTGIMGIISEDKIVGHVPLEVSRYMFLPWHMVAT